MANDPPSLPSLSLFSRDQARVLKFNYILAGNPLYTQRCLAGSLLLLCCWQLLLLLLLFCFHFICVIHSSAFGAAVCRGRPAAAGAAGATLRKGRGSGYKCHFIFSDILEFKLPQAAYKCIAMRACVCVRNVLCWPFILTSTLTSRCIRRVNETDWHTNTTTAKATATANFKTEDSQ